MEDTKEKNAVNASLQKIQKMVEKVKEDKGVLLEYMKVWEREQIIREEGMEAGMEAGIAAGKAEQEKETEKERQRAEKAEQEVAELRRKLEELQKQR